MNTKIVVVLVLGIILLGLGALFLIQRNAPKNSSQNDVSNSGPNIPGEPRRFLIGRSTVSGYTVTIINEQELIDAIQSNNIFGRTFIYLDDQTTGDRPLENIAFQISENPPAVGVEYEGSDYVQLVSGGIIFTFVVSPDDLSSAELGNEFLRKIIEYPYRLSFPNAADSEVEEAVNRVYDSLLEKNDSYIVIKQE